MNKDQAEKAGITGLADDETVNLRYRLSERGNRETKNKEDSYGVQFGIKGYLGESTWDWDVNFSTNVVTRKEAQQGGSIKSKILDAIDDGTFVPNQNSDLSGAAHIATCLLYTSPSPRDS